MFSFDFFAYKGINLGKSYTKILEKANIRNFRDTPLHIPTELSKDKRDGFS